MVVVVVSLVKEFQIVSMKKYERQKDVLDIEFTERQYQTISVVTEIEPYDVNHQKKTDVSDFLVALVVSILAMVYETHHHL